MAAYHVLNTDASKPDGSRGVAIGVVLRQKTKKNRPLEVIGYISKRIRDPKSIQEGEYLALIEGLKLASRYAPTDLRVFVDSPQTHSSGETAIPGH